jgi:radical SAM-linked protein
MLMRALIQYTREERVKYISHLDLMRAMQRAVRRAGIPIAYSQGFNPHPVMAFASALPVGVTSEGEYMDIELSEPMDIAVLKEKLNNTLPKGITATEAVVIDKKAPSLMSLIQRADYRVTADDPAVNWRHGIAALNEKPELWVEKKGKKGVTEINLKEGIYEIHAGGDKGSELYLSLQSGSSGNLKPELVINELLKLMGMMQDADGQESEYGSALPVTIHRLGLYYKQDGNWVTPLALNRY